MKIISKKYWQDIKNFVEQILKKFGGFYLKKINLVPHQNIGKNIGGNSCIYQPIFKRFLDRYIGRSLLQTTTTFVKKDSMIFSLGS